MNEDFILFQEVEKQQNAAQGEEATGGHGYEIWLYTAEEQMLVFLNYITPLMLDYWIDHYANTGEKVLMKSLDNNNV
jgi:hypothetical protein